ncbi:MAG: M23 family metallopeptidase [Candidatus Methylomirabilales bacterium]
MRASGVLAAGWLLLLACLPGAAAAREEIVRLEPAAVPPGGVAVLTLARPGIWLGVAAGGRRLPLPEPGTGPVLVGVDLDTPAGPLPLVVDLQESGRLLRLERTLRVLASPYPVQRLTLPSRFTQLDPATLERAAAEKAALDRLWETARPRLWREPFRPPLDGLGSGSGFGHRRIINGEPRAAHSGSDVAAPAGTPVLAANAAEVALVADQFFAGTAVVLDHGDGLFTMYFHLQESLVQTGQRVARGQPIGRVGATGRASGPHLHWGVRLHGARVDPAELLRATAE